MQIWFERVPAPKSLIPVPGSDHFFQGHLEAVQTMIANFIGDTLYQEDFPGPFEPPQMDRR
jgi:alpha/beta superfamily hydrolase